VLAETDADMGRAERGYELDQAGFRAMGLAGKFFLQQFGGPGKSRHTAYQTDLLL
jgi:hypothetical protein